MRKGQFISLIPMLMLILIFTACAPEAAPVPTPAAVTQPPEVTKKEPWQEEWQKTLTLAKRDGKLVIYRGGLGVETRVVLIKHLKELFGIPAEITLGRGGEISEKLLRERRAGLYLADLYIGGASGMVPIMKPAGLLDSLEPQLFHPEVLDPRAWWNGELPWVDKDKMIFSPMAYPNLALAINTNLVSEGEIKGYGDLLNPNWKGKIVMFDPIGSGIGRTWFGTMLVSKILDVEYMRKLAMQEPTILRDARLQGEWLARGKYAIGLNLSPQEFDSFVKLGMPLKHIYPVEGAYLTGGSGSVSLLNKAPHPNAARLFINWFLSKEGVLTASRAQATQSAREDVPTDHLGDYVRRPGMKYFDSSKEEVMMKREAYIEVAEEIFGHLLR